MARRDDFIDGQIQMINWALLPAGKSFAAHYHQDMQEVFIILSGTAVITIGDEMEELNRGDAVFIPTQSVHRMENTGSLDVEYLALGISKTGTGKTVNVTPFDGGK